MGFLQNIKQKIGSSPVVQKVVSGPVANKAISAFQKVVTQSPVGRISNAVTNNIRNGSGGQLLPKTTSTAPAVSSSPKTLFAALYNDKNAQIADSLEVANPEQKDFNMGDANINLGAAQSTGGTSPLVWVGLAIAGLFLIKKMK